jgi:hypothetical protein
MAGQWSMSAVAAPALAQVADGHLGSLRGGEILPDPDFSLL